LQQLPKIVPQIGPNTILPVPNPTGNPYINSQIKKLPEVSMLKGLQVKAELSKLGVAPRAYSEYLLKDEADPEDTNMVDTSVYNNSKRLRMFERFAKIESARPALPQFAVNLTRRLQQLIPGSGKNQEQGKANSRLEKRAI
jgi:hypothetical protein